jgi:hypothetical protein
LAVCVAAAPFTGTNPGAPSAAEAHGRAVARGGGTFRSRATPRRADSPSASAASTRADLGSLASGGGGGGEHEALAAQLGELHVADGLPERAATPSCSW